MATSTFPVRGVGEKSDFDTITSTLMHLPGVSKVDINPGIQRVVVEFDDKLINNKDIAESISIAEYYFS
jgi:copper chaperone CopZ